MGHTVELGFKAQMTLGVRCRTELINRGQAILTQ